MVKTQYTKQRFLAVENSWLTFQAYLILFIISKEDDSCETVARCHFSNQQNGFNGLTGGFLLLQNFCVAISVSPHVCFILVLILISMFLR